MNSTTKDIIKAAISADPSIAAEERGRYMQLLTGNVQPVARPEPLMSFSEAARCLGVTNRRISQLCQEARLTPVRIGRARATRVTVASLAELVNAQTSKEAEA